MKKIKYQLTARSFILIEPKNKKEEEVIKNLNNEFDKFKKEIVLTLRILFPLIVL